MADIPGSWKPSQDNLLKAEAVLEATKSSGNLYRNGLGMIASENIVSPMVQKVVCSDWIKNLLSDLSSTAEKYNMKNLLKPIYTVLQEGNQSMKWIDQFEKGISIEKIMNIAIDDMIKSEEGKI